MRYLLNVVETYRVTTPEEAIAMRDAADNSSEYSLESFSYTTKFDKKTEEEYQVVKMKKKITEEKDPEVNVNISYEYE